MPELPEVETVRRGLEDRTAGLVIEDVEVVLPRAIASPADPGAFRRGLAGSRVLGWRRRGKYLLADLDDTAGVPAGAWVTHLRMTGQFLWQPDAATPETHTRVRVWMEQGRELRFVDPRSFGRMWWIPADGQPVTAIPGLARLGPEPFDPLFSADYLRRRLQGSRRPIKNALLDQSLVAGVGNIYADEALFASGIRPQTPSGRLGLPRLETLRTALVEVLQLSIGAGGTTFRDFRDLSGRNGNYGGEAWVYRRGGLPCRRCQTPLRRDRLGGRSSHWCPTCQR